MVRYRMEVCAKKQEKETNLYMDKIGGYPTHLPPMELYQKKDYFLMQIYQASGILPKKEGVLCWQFYQSEFGGFIHKIIEVPIGAKQNEGTQIRKRRWLKEYQILYQKEEWKEEEEIELDSFIINGENNQDFMLGKSGYRQIGMIANVLCPNRELHFGIEFVRLAINEKTKQIEVF